jgi:hypothetical protein
MYTIVVVLLLLCDVKDLTWLRNVALAQVRHLPEDRERREREGKERDRDGVRQRQTERV